ncbi:MAG: metallophosphoesterase [Flavobacteriales bacterium]|nr:metallophosphoesterase [Flavobacteriales bacterium]
MKRRSFIRKSLWGAAGMGLMAWLYAWKVEPFWLEFVQRKLPIKNLPPHLSGKILMQISDMHVGNAFDYHFIIESFEEAKKYKPDFVVYTGDYVTYRGKEQLRQLNEVLQHAVTGKLGTVAILGNHDYGRNWRMPEVADNITGQMTNVGVEVLRNRQHEIDGLNFIGLDDCWGLNFNPAPAMDHYDAAKANIVLCHNPDVCDMDVWNNYQGWVLSGHTHGGQCKPPFLDPPMLPVKNKKYTAGEIDLEDGRRLYINRALGNLHHIRFNVRPEITVFELEAV